MEWLDNIVSQIVNLLGQGHPATLTALFFVVVFTEIGVPFPFIMDSALLLTSYQHGLSIQVAYTIAVVIAGRECGASIVYWASYFLGRRLLIWISKHFPRLNERIDNLVSRLNRNAPLAVVLLRLSGLLHWTSIAAGLVSLPFRYFILGVTISAIIFDGSIITLGIITGHSFRILGFKPTYWSIIAGFIVIMVIVLLIRFLVSRKKRVNNIKV